MRSQVLLLLSVCTCFVELEAVSLSKKDVPDFFTQGGGAGNGLMTITNIELDGSTNQKAIPGAIDGKKWQHSKSLGVNKDAAVWSGNNWAKRNIWDGKHMVQHEEASALSNQGGKARQDPDEAVGTKQNKKAIYAASRQYSKTRNQGTSQATLTGKSASFTNVFGGRNYGDGASSSNNVDRSSVGSGSGEADVKSDSDLTSTYGKRGRTQTFKLEGKSAGDGTVTRSFSRDFNTLSAAAKAETGTGGADILGDGTSVTWDAAKGAAHGVTGSIAGDVEVGEMAGNGERRILQKNAPNGIHAGRNLLPMAGVADTAEWTTADESARPNKMSHTEWLKYTYHQGPDCVVGQMEGTNGCRWQCGTITGGDVTPNFASGAVDACTTFSKTCHDSVNPALPATAPLGTGVNNKACSSGCTGAGACLNPFA